MNEDLDTITKLLEKYQLGLCTPAEKAMLESWYNEQLAGDQEPLPGIDFQQQQEALFAKIRKGIAGGRQERVLMWPRIAVAASLLLAVATGFYFYRHTGIVAPSPIASTSNDIAPGKTGATLTLADGRRILIDAAAVGQLAGQAGTRISKSAGGGLVYEVTSKDNRGIIQFNTLETSRRQEAQVRLPDGTRVWLNAASTLRYPASFGALQERTVELHGEAYFEVASDKAHPFKVKTGNEDVEVLGTHFNINAYDDEPSLTTTLLEGMVRLTPLTPADKKEAKTPAARILKPGEQALLTNNHLSVGDADTEEVLAWKNGDFIFKEASIESVMRKLARWYDIDVTYQGEMPKDGIQGAISKFRNISQVLNVLEQTKAAHFTIEGRNVIVSK